MICKNCGMTFDEPDLIRDTDDAYGTRISYVTDTVCPYCGSSDIAETAACAECGGDYPEGAESSPLCQSCEKELKSKVCAAMIHLRMELSDAEIEYINDQWEGYIQL